MKNRGKELFDKLLTKAKQELSGKKIYVQDAFCGASLQSRKAVRFVTEIAWQAHFVKNMFIRPSQEELENFKADFIVYNACKCINEGYKQDGLNSEVFVIFNVKCFTKYWCYIFNIFPIFFCWRDTERFI